MTTFRDSWSCRASPAVVICPAAATGAWTVRQDSTTHLEAARRPYPSRYLGGRGSDFGGFCYTLL